MYILCLLFVCHRVYHVLRISSKCGGSLRCNHRAFSRNNCVLLYRDICKRQVYPAAGINTTQQNGPSPGTSVSESNRKRLFLKNIKLAKSCFRLVRCLFCCFLPSVLDVFSLAALATSGVARLFKLGGHFIRWKIVGGAREKTSDKKTGTTL